MNSKTEPPRKPHLLPQNTWNASLAFSPDGRTLAVGGEGVVVLWDVKTLSVSRVLMGKHGKNAEHICFSKDGSALIVCFDKDYQARIFDAKTWEQVGEIDGDGNDIRALVLHPVEDYLAGGNAWYGKVCLWQVPVVRPVAEFQAYPAGLEYIRAISFSGDGRYIASCREGDDDIRLFDADSHNRIGTLWGHRGEIKDLAFSSQNALLVSGDSQGTIRVWDVADRQHLKTLEGHGSGQSVNRLRLSRDGKTLYSAGADATIRIWDIEHGEMQRVLEHDQSVQNMAIRPDGFSLASDGAANAVVFWDLSSPQSDLRDVVYVEIPKNDADKISMGSTTDEDDWSGQEEEDDWDDDCDDYVDEKETVESVTGLHSISDGTSISAVGRSTSGSAGDGLISWTELLATSGQPVESSILTDEAWKAAKEEGRVVSVICDKSRNGYPGVVGLSTKRVMCRVVFPAPLPQISKITGINLDDIDWDFSQAVADTARATELLLEACRNGDLQRLEAAIRSGADVNYVDWAEQEVTPLKLAVTHGHETCVDVLIQAKADISGDTGAILWRLAMLHQHPAVAARLEERGADAARQETLLQAAYEGKLEVVSDLIQRGAEVDKSAWVWSPYSLEGTPLNAAILADHRHVVDYLLSAGADICAQDEQGITPWCAAAAKGQSDLCSLLESRGASVDPQSAMLLAARIGNSSAFQALIALGADPNGRGKLGQERIVPLEAAFASDQMARYTNADEEDDDEAERIESVRQEGMESLLSLGAEPNSFDSSGQPLLMRAVAMMRDNLVSLLLNYGADVNATDRKGNTALHTAADLGNTACAKSLLLSGADPNAGNRQGQVPFTLLFNESSEPSADVASWLIAFGAKLDIKAKNGKSIRQYAKRALRRAQREEEDTESIRAILELLDAPDVLAEYAGVFAKDADTADEHFDRANCALNLLADPLLAGQELASAVRIDTNSLPRLLADMDHEDLFWPAVVAVIELGAIAAPAVPQLIARLGEEDTDLRSIVELAFVEIGADAVPALLAELTSSSMQIAARAAVTLCKIDIAQADDVTETLMTRLPRDEASVEGEPAFGAARIREASGEIRLLQEDIAGAVTELEAAVQLNPSLQVGPWGLLAALKELLGDGSLTRSLALYTAAVEENNNGDYEAAKQALLGAIAEAPDFPWGYNDLAWLMATCADHEYRDGAAAVQYALKASELTGNRYHCVLDTLAAAYAETGNYAKAAEVEARAVQVAPMEACAEYEFNLQRYQAELPWTDYDEAEVDDTEGEYDEISSQE